MSSIANAADTPAAIPETGAVARIFGGFLDMVAAVPQATRSAREYERLSRLSDGELARMGLRREDVARHALRSFLRD